MVNCFMVLFFIKHKVSSLCYHANTAAITAVISARFPEEECSGLCWEASQDHQEKKKGVGGHKQKEWITIIVAPKLL